METLEAIFSRRSIRKFKPDPIPREMLETVLRAAMAAPSAGNAQPWHFIVVDSKEILEQIPKLNPYAKMAVEAPLGILVCAELKLEKFPGFWVQDLSAAVENLLLAAHDLGLGAVWTGIYPVEERVKGFQRLFKLPEEVVPLAFIPLGFPNQEYSKVDRFKKERIHYNTWDEGY
ncbi:MAG: Nitroreductase [Desulfonauticus sp. 38_4375]|jgi:nitroreductase|nr:MAG: Nitroreductase [Desulfonauticus sp. 38_4375]